MTAALFLAGGCYLLTAVGLAGVRRSARLLLIVAGVAVIGIATSPEPASGPTARHLAWTVLGAVTITVWPAFVARRGSPRPRILSVYGSVAVTVVFVALLGWFFAEAQGGSMVGLAERVTTSVEALWPSVVALALRRTNWRTRPGPT
jgi:FtsH-binding integral membrane protein